MKKFIAMVMLVFLVCMIMFTGCNNAKKLPTITAASTPQPTPAKYVLTIEMAHDGVCAIANAFLQDKITAERAMEELALVADEITKAIDGLNAKKKKNKKSKMNKGGVTAKKSEVEGLEMLEGDIEMLRSYLSDYNNGDTSMSIIEERIKEMQNTDYSMFNE